MNRRSLAFIFLLFPTFAFANMTEVSIKDGDRLSIIGFDANVNLNFVPGAKTLKINGDVEGRSAGRYFFERRANEISIRMNDYGSRKEWRDAISTPTPANKIVTIEISGFAISADIQLKTGKVYVNSWNKDLNVTINSGKFYAENVSGTVNLHLQKGEIALTEQTGKTSIDSYNSVVQIKKLNADADINLFSGQLNIEKCHGYLSINSQSALSKLSKCEGSLRYEIGKGSLFTQAFQGRIDGSSTEGSANISLESESEVNIKTISGKVSITLPQQSGAFLNLVTGEGDIYIPNELKVVRTATEKLVKGRLHGEARKATVVVRSTEGIINIK